jgi:hypothetical protein
MAADHEDLLARDAASKRNFGMVQLGTTTAGLIDKTILYISLLTCPFP